MTLKSWTMPFCEMQSLSSGPGLWRLSASGTNEYYLEDYDYFDCPENALPVDSIMAMMQDVPYGVQYQPSATQYSPGTPGALASGTFGIGDNDGLSKNALYVRLRDDSDPNSLVDGSLSAVAVVQPDTSSWVQSTEAQNEYYYNAPIVLWELSRCSFMVGWSEETLLTNGTVGSLQPGEFGLRQSDITDPNSLTLHVRLPDDIDPDTVMLVMYFPIYGGEANPDITWVSSNTILENYALLYTYLDTSDWDTSIITEEPIALLLNGTPVSKVDGHFDEYDKSASVAQNEWTYGGRKVDRTTHDNLYIRLENDFCPKYLRKDSIQIPQYNTLVDNTGYSQCVIIDMLFNNQDTRDAQVYVRVEDSDSNEKFMFVFDIGAKTTYHLNRKMVLNSGDKLLLQSTTEFVSIYANGDQN